MSRVNADRCMTEGEFIAFQSSRSTSSKPKLFWYFIPPIYSDILWWTVKLKNHSGQACVSTFKTRDGRNFKLFRAKDRNEHSGMSSVWLVYTSLFSISDEMKLIFLLFCSKVIVVGFVYLPFSPSPFFCQSPLSIFLYLSVHPSHASTLCLLVCHKHKYRECECFEELSWRSGGG